MPHRSLPGTFLARLQESFLLIGALTHRGIVVIGLRSLEYAFTRETPEGERQFRRPILPFVRLGYWLVGGVTTSKWDTPEPRASSTKQP